MPLSSITDYCTEAMRAYARQAKNKQLEVDAAEIRIRAERRLGEMMAAQRDAGMMNRGAEGNPGGRGAEIVRVENGPAHPTLAEAGFDKHLADRARKYAAIPENEFNDIVTEWRDRVEQENKGDDPLGFVVSLNLKRRHLTETQRAMVAGKVANMRDGDNQHGTKGPQICGGSSVSAAEAAKMMNVAPRSVESTRAVHDRAVPELREKAEAGDVSVSASEATSRLPEPEQKEVIASA